MWKVNYYNRSKTVVLSHCDYFEVSIYWDSIEYVTTFFNKQYYRQLRSKRIPIIKCPQCKTVIPKHIRLQIKLLI